MTEPAFIDDDQRFAQLLDEYASACRADQLDNFWSVRTCSAELRRRVEQAHDGLQQLDSFLTEHPSICLPPTATDDNLSQLLRKPTQIGRFHIVRELGRGGFGIIYLADDPTLNRQVAIKVPRIETLGTKSLQNRFAQEAEIAASLDHPHILPVFEVGTTADSIYIVGLYCPGTNLAEWLANNSGQLNCAQVVELMISICDAMCYCHQRGVLHRDLKPANILLFPTPHGSLPFLPRINDFGLAKVLESAHSDTASSALLGTPLYMAPEQICSESDKISPATDVYGLGAILYELLTGQPPFRGTIAQILDQIRLKEPIYPRELNKQVPVDLETICLKSLAKQPHDRYSSAEYLLVDLIAFREGRAIVAQRRTQLRRLQRWLSERAGVVAACLLIVAATIAGALTNAPGGSPSRTEPTEPTEARLKDSIDAVAINAKQVNDLRRAFNLLKLGKNDETRKILEAYRDTLASDDTPSFPWYYLQARLNCRRTDFNGLTGKVLIADIAHSGKWIVAGDRTGRVCIWDRSGNLVDSLEYSDKEVCAIKFSPDDKLLATAGQDSKIHIWRTGSWEHMCELNVNSGTITSIDWSPDGQRLVCGSRQKSVSLWDVKERLRIANLTPVDDTVRCVAWSGDGQVIGANIGSAFALWSSTDYHSIKQVKPSDFVLHSLAFSPDSKRLVMGGASRKLVLADTTTSIEFQEYPGNTFFKFVAWSPDGRHISGGMSSGGPRLWSAEDMQEEATLYTAEEANTRTTRFTDDSRHLLSVAEETNEVKLWDVGSAIGYYEHYPMERILAWRALDGRIVYVDSTPDATRLIQIGSKNPIVEMSGPTTCAGLSTDGRLMARLHSEQLDVWDVATGLLKLKLPLPSFSVVELKFSPDNRRLLAISPVCDWALVDLETATILAKAESDSQHAVPLHCFSADGRYAVLRNFPSVGPTPCEIRQLSDGQAIDPVPSSHDHKAVAADQTFKKLYLAFNEGIVVYDIDSRTLNPNHFVPRRGIQRLAISPDGLTLAAWLKDEGIFLWDITSGQELFPVLETKTVIEDMQFTSNTQLVCHRNFNGTEGLLIFNQ